MSKLIDCTNKAKRLPLEIRQAIYQNAQNLQNDSDMNEVDAAKTVINQLLDVVKRDINTIETALKKQKQDEADRINEAISGRITETPPAEAAEDEEAQFATGPRNVPHASGTVVGGSTASTVYKPTKNPAIKSMRGFNIITNARRFWDGTADVFLNTPGLEYVGHALRELVDTQRKYEGQFLAPWRKLMPKVNLEDFKSYWYAKEFDKNPDGAEFIYDHASEDTKKAIDLWKKQGKITGDIARAHNVQVFDPRLGKYRPMGTIKDYFPRVLRPEFQEMLNDPMKNKKTLAEYNQFVNDALNEGVIKDPAEATKYLQKVQEAFQTNDRFNNIEMARSPDVRLPMSAYNFSPEAVTNYLQSFSRRMAQIETLGQKVGEQGKDLLDVAQSETTDKYTRDYLTTIKSLVYGSKMDEGWQRGFAMMSQAATGLQLGNWITSTTNLMGGLGTTAGTYGFGNTLKGVVQTAADSAATRIGRAMGKEWSLMDDVYEKGVLKDDMLNLSTEDYGSLAGERETLVSKGARGLLSVGAFNATERFVRKSNYVAAKAFLRQAKAAYAKDPSGARWGSFIRSALNKNTLQYAGFIKRLGMDPHAVLTETPGPNGETPLADRFYRAAVNEVQGGYSFDQVPAFSDTPTGRIILKYQKYGTQQTRHFWHNAVLPAVRAATLGKFKQETVKVFDPKTGEMIIKKVPGSFVPLASYLVAMAAAGMGADELKKWVFGLAKKGATLPEILAAWARSDLEGFKVAMSKLGQVYAGIGAAGMFSNYGQQLWDVADRMKFKNPLEPPAISPLHGVGELFMRMVEQGKLTTRDFNDVAMQQVGIYRAGMRVGTNIADKMGVETETAMKQKLGLIQGMYRRYGDTIGAEEKKTTNARFAKNPDTPFKLDLKERLFYGDVQGAKKLLNEHFKGMTLEQQKTELRNLKASVRMSQPIKVGGYADDDIKSGFLKWIVKNQSPADVVMVKKIDKTYRDTAVVLGLMKPEEPTSQEDFNESMRKWQR